VTLGAFSWPWWRTRRPEASGPRSCRSLAWSRC
jgi:hypothetical protein